MQYSGIIKFLFFLFILMQTCANSFAQEYFMWEKKGKIKKEVEKSYDDRNVNYKTTETDTTLTITLIDSITLPLTNIFYFNPSNHYRCEKQDMVFSCDSCMQKEMQFTISRSNALMHWRQVSNEKYYAKFPWNTFMECIRINGVYILRYSKQKRKDI